MIKFNKKIFGEFTVILILTTLFVLPIMGFTKIRVPALILITILHLFLKINKNQIFYILFMLPIIFFYFLYFFNDINQITLLSYWVIAIIGLIYSSHLDLISDFIKIIIFINTLLVFIEYINMDYLWNITEDSFYGRSKGFFSAPKEAGMFLSVFVAYYFKKLDLFYLFLLLITSFFIGSRTLLIFSFVTILYYFFYKFKYESIRYNIIYYLVFVVLLLIGFTFSDFLYDSFEVIGRLNTLSDLEEGGNDLRLHVLKKSIQLYSSGSLHEMFFGFGTQIEDIIGNGAENGYLNILLRYGIFGLIFYLIVIFISFRIKTSNSKLLMLLLLILLIGNRGLSGLLDGFVFFAFLGSVLEKIIQRFKIYE